MHPNARRTRVGDPALAWLPRVFSRGQAIVIGRLRTDSQQTDGDTLRPRTNRDLERIHASRHSPAIATHNVAESPTSLDVRRTGTARPASCAREPVAVTGLHLRQR